LEIVTTTVFSNWAKRLRDKQAARAIALRLARIRAGNLGDAKSVGGGVSEPRIHVAKGYRLYHCRRGKTLIILLCGGEKSSQAADIRRAQAMAKDLPETQREP
jgi:putative addiction module killer protein